MKKRWFPTALLLVFALLLAGCGVSEKDIKILVQGNLDKIYLDAPDPTYLKLVDITEEDAHQDYEAGIDTEVDYFIEQFEILDTREETREAIRELYYQIYPKSSYQVGEPVKQDDGSFKVPVDIQPLDIFDLMTEDALIAELTSMVEQLPAEQQADLSDEAFEQLWAEAVLKLCHDLLPQMSTLDTVTVDVVVEEEDDAFSMTQDSLNEVDRYIINYRQ